MATHGLDALLAQGRSRSEVRLGLRALEWLTIVLPLAFLGIADFVRERLFPGHFYSPASRGFFFAALAVAIVLFSHLVFRVVRRLQGRIVRQNEHLAALNAIARASAESWALQPLLQVGLEQVLSVLRADAGLICTVDLARGEHTAVAAKGFSRELVAGLQRAKLCDDPIASEVVGTGRPVALERLRSDPRVSAVAEREGVRSAISVPLKSHRDVTGVMAVASRDERRFGELERELLASVGGQLGMAIGHAAVFERSLQRNREMEALLTIGNAVTSSLDLPQVLDRALETILEVTSAEAAEIWLLEGEDELQLTHHRGAAPEAFHQSTRLQVGTGLPGLAVATREPAVAHDLGEDERLLRSAVREAGFQSYCALPLLLRGAPLGALGIAARAAGALSAPEELRLLAGISEAISVAIENARLYEQVQDTAVLEERERIAREMHDGLAQVLTYVNAESLVIGKLLASGRAPEAAQELARMEEAVRDVYADVRGAILGLKTSPRSEGGFLPSIAAFLESFEAMTGIEARLRVGEGAEAARLSSSAEIQLTRIVQEALANVRKHARARSATVSVERHGEGLRLAVEDDGQGFDLDGLQPRGWPRFGLQTMRERAEAVGGAFRIATRPGGGTSVVVELAPVRAGRAAAPLSVGEAG